MEAGKRGIPAKREKGESVRRAENRESGKLEDGTDAGHRATGNGDIWRVIGDEPDRGLTKTFETRSLLSLSVAGWAGEQAYVELPHLAGMEWETGDGRAGLSFAAFVAGDWPVGF